MKKLLLAAAAAAMFAPIAAHAEYPEKPVEFVVPFPPGDLEDVLTRMIADEFQATYGVPAAVVGDQRVYARAPRDGRSCRGAR